MPDKTGPKDLVTVLARLREEWQELADLLTSQGMLWHQHTEETQSLDGLWMAMVKAYGAMHHLDVVTIIYYRVDKEED